MGHPGLGPRALGEMREQGSRGADAAQSSPEVSSSCSHQVPSDNNRGWGGWEPLEVTRGLWLTDPLEHMADTLLGTSRLVGEERNSAVRINHSFKTHLWSTYICQARLEVPGLVPGESGNKHSTELATWDCPRF